MVLKPIMKATGIPDSAGKRILSLLLLCFIWLYAGAADASDTFNKAKSKIESAKSLSADFSMSYSGGTVKGKIYSKGKKFAITSNATSNWYNGKDLYTYDASQNETYVMTPTQAELSEANPLLFISSAANYKVTPSKSKKTGSEVVVLIPKKSGTGVKSVTVEIDTKTLLPKSISVTLSSGGKMNLTLQNVKLNPDIADSTFEYPKSKYSGAQLIDMR